MAFWTRYAGARPNGWFDISPCLVLAVPSNRISFRPSASVRHQAAAGPTKLIAENCLPVRKTLKQFSFSELSAPHSSSVRKLAINMRFVALASEAMRALNFG